MIKNKKTVVICQIYLNNFAGSEMVSAELAEEFLQREWQVIIDTSRAQGPLADSLRNNGIIIITPDIEPELEKFKDSIQLIWIHHHIFPEVLINLITNNKSKIPVVFNHMSSFTPLEFPTIIGFEEEAADIILYNSIETKNRISPLFSMNLQATQWLFPNPAPREFHLNSEVIKKNLAIKLQITVISNHVPQEINEAIILLKEKGHSINSYGAPQKNAQRITPNIIRNSDLVITIGKSVQYCLAMKVPVYNYDHFGGPGYLNEQNFSLSEENNFSGRGFSKKSAIEICDELIKGFSSACQFYTPIRNQYIQHSFSLKNKLDEIMSQLESNKPRPQTNKLIDNLILLKNWTEISSFRCMSANQKRIIQHLQSANDNLKNELSIANLQIKNCEREKEQELTMLSLIKNKEIQSYQKELLALYKGERWSLKRSITSIKNNLGKSKALLKPKSYLEQRSIYKTIKNSILFDVEYYLVMYPDVRKAKIDPIKHYIFNGAKEERNPSKEFDTRFYQKKNVDVKMNGINPLYHYICYGSKKGRKIKGGTPGNFPEK